jgi:hypothetical protein
MPPTSSALVGDRGSVAMSTPTKKRLAFMAFLHEPFLSGSCVRQPARVIVEVIRSALVLQGLAERQRLIFLQRLLGLRSSRSGFGRIPAALARAARSFGRKYLWFFL